jgi:ADP-ribose pyrophosphatase YjhB (NUDIX family)
MTHFGEFAIENGQTFDQKCCQTGFIPKEAYEKAHEGVVILCHDVAIIYPAENKEPGILLIKRNTVPDTGIYWPVGGRALRGVPIEESLKQKVKEECNVDITDIEYIGTGRTMFRTDPFGHNRGTDTQNLMFVAKGSDTIMLDDLHSEHLVVTQAMFTEEFKLTLHPIVQQMISTAFEKYF